MLIVNEAGLYRLMMRSNHPKAERFQDWITDEVIPAIRKHGVYSLAKPKTRLEREARRLKCDGTTAKVRCDQFVMNVGTREHILSERGCVVTKPVKLGVSEPESLRA